MNHTILTADRHTHARIVVVSLACATVFVAVMIAGRVASPDLGVAKAQAPLIIKAQPTQLTGKDRQVVIR